jgi:predicted regulator of Ras-like GTPase activity (Roadblock/LC7/MglB family)
VSNLSKLARTQIAKAPEVLATVVTDRIGMLLDATGDVDGESLGAVNAVTADALIKAGETLGLGLLHRCAISGARRACVISVHDDEIVGFYLDSGKALGPFERKLDGIIRQ